MNAILRFDGGCSPNPGQKYGSYSVMLDDAFELQRTRFQLGYGTNNEAEFEALHAGLGALTTACNKAGIQCSVVSVGIYTDSTIVRNWLQRFERFKPQNCKNERRLVMGKLAGLCFAALKPYKAWSIEWNSRDCNVAKFGH